METIVALYNSFDQAQTAVNDLVHKGVSRDHISLVANNATGEYERYTVNESGDAVKPGEGAAFGAATGGIIGALAGLGALAIPGIGPVIAAGPLVAALTGGVLGAAAGAPTGGIVAALVYTNKVDPADAEVYAEGVRRGGTLVTVDAEEGTSSLVREVLNSHGASDVRRQGEYYRNTGWSRFDDKLQPYSADEIRRYREQNSALTTDTTPSRSKIESENSSKTY